MENMDKFVEYAPLIVVILAFIWQNNIFVKPEQLEKKHREIMEEIRELVKDHEKEMNNKFVEVNAYKEFQNRVYSELEKVNNSLEELKNYLLTKE